MMRHCFKRGGCCYRISKLQSFSSLNSMSVTISLNYIDNLGVRIFFDISYDNERDREPLEGWSVVIIFNQPLLL